MVFCFGDDDDDDADEMLCGFISDRSVFAGVDETYEVTGTGLMLVDAWWHLRDAGGSGKRICGQASTAMRWKNRKQEQQHKVTARSFVCIAYTSNPPGPKTWYHRVPVPVIGIH